MLNIVILSFYCLFLCIFAPSSKLMRIGIMNTEIKIGFYEFRKKFNKMFKLSLNGKFKGVFTLLKIVGTRQFEHFMYKIEKLLRGRGRYHLPIDLKHKFTLAGNKITLYSF